jgi:molybdenum-dependent DNA-binding transcriptional regulator ModE
LVSITVKVQDSADNSSFADVAILATLVATGAGGTGSAAASLTQRAPLTLRRYVRVNIAASATAGDNTVKKATLALAY